LAVNDHCFKEPYSLNKKNPAEIIHFWLAIAIPLMLVAAVALVWVAAWLLEHM